MKDIKNFQQMYRDGKLDRREFLAAMSALGLSATAAGGLLTSAGALAMTPKKGGTATYANNIHGPDDQMDPIVFTSGIDYARGRVTYNGLVQIRDNMVLAPELAEEWSVSADATEYTFKIRKGVTFHDGSPLTADDVEWSMNRHLGEDSPSVAKALFAAVKEWKKVDSHTVKAILNSPDSDLPAKLGEKQTKIVKKDTVDFKKGNGTGPFVLESFEAGVRSTHVRNENYWREGANFDAVEVTAITDPLARANALIAGDVDLINQVDSKSVALVEQAEGVRVVSTPSSGFAGICILKNTQPGENDDFVKGMQYIQDRERIVRSILKGHGTPGNDHPIGVAFGADHCSRAAAARVRPGQGQVPPREVRDHLRRAPCRAGQARHRGDLSPDAGEPEEDRLRPQHQEGAERRLLGRGVDEGADERGVLEHATHRERADGHPVRAGRGVERYLLAQRPHGRAAHRPACGDRHRQAPRDAVRDADPDSQR